MPRLVEGVGALLLVSIVAGILAGGASATAPLKTDLAQAPAPAAQLSVTGKPRALISPYGGLVVDTRVLATCPDAGLVCSGTAAITGPGAKTASTLASAPINVSPGISQSITLVLGKRGRKLLMQRGKLKIAVSVSITGPDGATVTAASGGTIKQPKSHG
jgi:hypothetical protein